MKLKKMTDFVLEQNNTIPKDLKLINNYKNIINYANFLKQPLKLEMFVPCSRENGLPLSLEGLTDSEGFVLDEIEFNEYEQAKEKVLFEDFELTENNKGEKLLLGDYTCLKVLDLDKMNIELLTKYTTINLTPNAIKQLGL